MAEAGLRAGLLIGDPDGEAMASAAVWWVTASVIRPAACAASPSPFNAKTWPLRPPISRKITRARWK